MHPNTTPTHEPNATATVQELRDVFSPLCDITADAAKPDVISGTDPELFEKARQHPVYNLPNDDTNLYMRWNFLKGFSADELQYYETEQPDIQEDPLAPSNPTMSDILTKRYFDLNPIDDATRAEPGGTRFAYSRVERLMEAYVANPDFDVNAWKEQEVRISTLPQAEQDAITAMQGFRGYNVGKWHGDTSGMKRTPTYLYSHNADLPGSPFTRHMAFPVGDYGEEFTANLIHTTQLMQQVANKQAAAAAAEVTEEHRETLSVYTGRAAMDGGASPEHTMETLQEGILSVGQTLALLTTEKVEGYDDPNLLVKDIVASGLVERLARYSPMGFVGPMALSGRYIPGTIVKTEKGVAFSEQFEAYLKSEKDRYIGQVALQTTVEQKDGHPTMLGKICPVAGRGGGIQKLATTFSELIAA